jgi:hypothetical protein
MRDGAIRAKPYESIITMGMRGSGDTALSASIDTGQLENIVDTQRQTNPYPVFRSCGVCTRKYKASTRLG